MTHIRSSALTGSLAHILKTIGPERDAAIEAMNRMLSSADINVGDLRITTHLDGEGSLPEEQEKQLAEIRAEYLRAVEAKQKAEEAEARLKATKARLKAERQASRQAKPAQDATPDYGWQAFVAALTELDVEKLSDPALASRGQTLSKAGVDKTTAKCQAHDLPFGKIVDEELRRHKARNTKPKVKIADHLAITFNCTPQWAYRCRDAYLIVASEDWQAIYEHNHNPNLAVAISPDMIIAWRRNYAAPAEPPSRKPTLAQRFQVLNKRYQTLRAAALKSSDADIKRLVKKLDAKPGV